jgi:hypothetical protein
MILKCSSSNFFSIYKSEIIIDIISIHSGAMMPLFGFLLADIFNNLGSATPTTTGTSTAPQAEVDPASIDSKIYCSIHIFQ